MTTQQTLANFKSLSPLGQVYVGYFWLAMVEQFPLLANAADKLLKAHVC